MVENIVHDQVLFAHNDQGQPLPSEHGRPLRLVAPLLYFWKIAKWGRGIEFIEEDRAGFWKERGYHLLGDPWLDGGQWLGDDSEWFGTGETTGPMMSHLQRREPVEKVKKNETG